MSSLKILLKNEINLLIGRIRGKQAKMSIITAGILLVIGLVGILALYSFQAYTMMNSFHQVGVEKLAVFHGIITCLTVITIIGVMRVSSNPKSSDTELLLSLPIKKSVILLVKTLSKYVFDFFFVLVLLAPYIVLYMIFAGFNLTFLLFSLFVVILLPLLSTGLSYIVDFITTRLFNKMRLGGLLKSIFSVFVFMLIMVLMLVKTFTYGTVEFATMEDYFADRPISNMILKVLFNGDVLSIFLFLVLTIVPFVVGLILYSFNYGKTFLGYTPKKKEYTFDNGKSSFLNLFKKEISYYATTPAYIVNTIIGPIMLFVVSIMIASMGFDKILGYLGVMVSGDLIVGIIALIFMGCISTCYISSCSISLEGSKMWILKSSPIKEKTLFLSKAFVNFIIVAPFILVSSIILWISLKLSFVQFLCILLVPTLFAVLISFSGLLINIWLPSFNWDHEEQVIKQSMSTLLTLIYGLVLTCIPVALYLLFNITSFISLLSICLSIYILILTLVMCILFTKGVKKFRKL